MFRRTLELEKNIELVQKSTRTMIEFFVPIHNWLRMKSRPYYNWSLRPYSHAVHWAILLIMISLSPLAFLNKDGKTQTSEAAGTTFTENFSTIAKKDSSTTATWDTVDKSVRMPYVQTPYLQTAGDIFPGDMTNTGSAFVTKPDGPNHQVAYIFGGQIGGAPNTTIFRYNPSAASGSRLTSIDTAQAHLNRSPRGRTSAVYAPETDTIYVLSGAIDDYSERIWSFNVAAETITLLPTAIDINNDYISFDSGLAYNNGKLYIVGGLKMFGFCFAGSDFCPTDNIYEYNISTSALTLLYGGGVNHRGDLSYAGSSIFFGSNGLMYIVGGYNKNNWVLHPPPGCVGEDCYNEIYDQVDSFETENIIRSFNVTTKLITTYTGKMYDLNGAVYSAYAQNGNDVYFYGGESGVFGSTLSPSSAISRLNLLDINAGMQLEAPSAMPDGAMFGQSAVHAGSNTAYVSGSNKRIYKHDMVGDTFTKIDASDSAFLNRSIAAYGQTSTDGYVFGGNTGAKTIVKYNFANKTSTLIPGKLDVYQPSGRGVLASNGRIYFFGGASTKAIYEFNPTDNSIATKGSLSSDCSVGSCSAVYNGGSTIIITSGADVQEYTPGATDSSTVTATLGGSVFTDGFWSGGKAYFVTNSSSPSCYSYDPTNNTSNPVTCPSFRNSSGATSAYITTGFSFQTDSGSYYIGPEEILYGIFSLGTTNISKLSFDASSISAQRLLMTVPAVINRSTNVLAAFHTSDGYVYIPMNDGNVATINLNIDTAKDTVVSTKMNTGNMPIVRATLTATDTKPTGTGIEYQMSSNGGANWETVQSGVLYKFSNVGTSLKWRATLIPTTADAPKITNISISYYGQEVGLYTTPTLNAYLLNAGSASAANSIGVKDSAGVNTIASRDLSIVLTGNSTSVNFAASPNGPWSGTLNLTLARGQEFVSYYVMGFSPGDYSINIHSDGLSDKNLLLHINPAAYLAKVQFTPNQAIVGSSIIISSDVSYNRITTLQISGTTVTFISSFDKDIIPPTTSSVNTENTIISSSSTIYSTVAGERSITSQIYKPNMFGINYIVEPTKITFLPATVSSAALTSSSKQTVKAGQSFDLSVSLFDKYGNLATNTTDSVTLSSTDQFFVPINYKFTSSDAGRKSFTGVALKSAGKQTLTIRDNATGATGTIDLFVLADSPLASNSKFTTDKPKLILSSDKANLTVKIADQFGNGIANTPVHIKNDLQFGSLDKFDGTTDSTGSAGFVYTPTKEGKETLSAFSDTFEIPDKVILENVPDTLANQISNVIDKLKNSATVKVIANIAKNVIATSVALSVVVLVASAISSASAAVHAVNYVLSLSLEALGIRKKRRSWGRVYNSTNGKGIDYALVRLYDQETMKLKGTIVTDIRGKYYFQPQPGTYVISVSKKGYIFPTEIFAKFGIAKINKDSARSNNHYVGQTININNKDNYLNIEIPVDPIRQKTTPWLRVKIMATEIIDTLTAIFSDILIPLLSLGLLASIFSAVVIPDKRNIIISAIYFVLVSIYIASRIVRYRRTGLVYDAKTKKPIAGAIISIFDKAHHTLKETRVTDKFGRYSLFAESGQYELQVTIKGYEKTDHKKMLRFLSKSKKKRLFSNEMIELRKPGFIIKDVAMKAVR